MGIRRVENGIKLREIDLTEEMVKRLVRQMEREEEQMAEREAQPKQSSSEQDSSGDHQNSSELETGRKNTGRCFTDYNRYSWEHIQAATSSFSSDLVIGKGTYGTVYKAKFQHTVGAVKVLNSLEGFGTQQLQQEVLCLLANTQMFFTSCSYYTKRVIFSKQN